jgi:hypothetical protein
VHDVDDVVAPRVRWWRYRSNVRPIWGRGTRIGPTFRRRFFTHESRYEAQRRPDFGLLRWFALLRRALALRFRVRFDMPRG